MGTKAKSTTGTKRSRNIGDLPAKPVSAEKAREVKGGLKMLTAANTAAAEAKGLASGINKSQ